ncbi:hypothetical protein EXT42_05180 [Pseudoalteromonas sp. CO302Y]|uniref:hypothetical protein n=1 Tax=unclassified Pseudoalteromonas TaxID=194690 RepID=UPI001023332C|nr:hypothetical protein EXT42_05180 [Pseudoalteromonas sp. CO302Y]RZG10802.1 hypothetical protein EXT40_05190 [Pseudoalteromonas sp. CO133X]
MKDEKYISLVCDCLLAFQMLEEGLKILIIGSYEIIAKSTPEEIDFKFDYGSIDDLALKMLIKKYIAVTSNNELIQALKSKDLTKWRNFFAHNAFHHELMKRNSKSQYTEHSYEDLMLVREKIHRLNNDLTKEVIKLRKVKDSI